MNITGGMITATIFVFIGLLVCLELGFRFGRWNQKRNPETAFEGVAPIEGTVFALLGLLLAFSISGAAGRLDARRQLIIQEANNIGTAYLRVDLLPPERQPEMRRLFRTYLDARLSAYENSEDETAVARGFAHAAALQKEIWQKAVEGSQAGAGDATQLLLLPAINEMIDITTSRAIALTTHLSPLIVLLIIGLALLSALLAGYSMSRRKARSWIHMLLFALLVAVTVYVILDLEYPRSGLIRLDSADQALYALRNSIE